MKTVKEIVSQNLISLRKKHSLTQVELSKKINYSDKAISRWEKGEVLPSIDILEQLALVYNVNITYFLVEHIDEQTKHLNAKMQNIFIAILVFAVLAVWSVAVIAFFAVEQFASYYCVEIFIWATPISALIIDACSRRYYKGKYFILTTSIFLWTCLVAIYLQWLYLNIWSVFLMGIPFQLTIILIDVLRKIKNPTQRPPRVSRREIKRLIRQEIVAKSAENKEQN